MCSSRQFILFIYLKRWCIYFFYMYEYFDCMYPEACMHALLMLAKRETLDLLDYKQVRVAMWGG